MFNEIITRICCFCEKIFEKRLIVGKFMGKLKFGIGVGELNNGNCSEIK